MTIRILPKERVKETAQRVWSLVQHADARCYPLVKSAADFERTLTWALEDDSGRARSCWKGRELLGVCCLFVNEEERYAQLIALYAWDRFRPVADAFLNWIDEAYPAFTIDAGVSGENARLSDALARHGYRIADDCLDLRHPLPAGDGLACEDEEGIALLEKGPLGAYAALHDAWFPGLYWNAKRLSETSDGWAVLTARQDGEITGAILLIFGKELAEVYGLHAADVAMARALLSAALAYCSEEAKGVGSLLFMAEAADEPCVRAALACGFLQMGRYVGWRKTPCHDRDD
ncbi:MAG: hypothetical protein GX417_00915 [Clostridiales bacterium]|nr:hypothetical protein [Clostridiales bacterium]